MTHDGATNDQVINIDNAIIKYSAWKQTHQDEEKCTCSISALILTATKGKLIAIRSVQNLGSIDLI